MNNAKSKKAFDGRGSTIEETRGRLLQETSQEVSEETCRSHETPTGTRCDLCQDTGEIDVYEQVYPNEPHMAYTGKETCVCKLPTCE